MIQVFGFLRRAEGLEPEAFRAHWRDVHGPLVAETPELARHVQHYEQNPRRAEDDARDGPFDGVAQLGFASAADLRAFFEEPAYAERVRPDERRFLDLDRCVLLTAEPPRTILDPGPHRRSAPLRMLTLLARRPGLAAAAFQRHWFEQHAPLVVDAMAPHLLGYEQNRRPAAEAERDPGGWDGVASVWYASMEAFRAAVGEGRYGRFIAPDEERFLDRARITFVITDRARVLIDRG